MNSARFLIAIALAACALAGCSSEDDAVIDIAVIEQTERLVVDGVRLSYGQQLVRGAVAEGLVTTDAGGETVPALAESWIVTDDGRSFIFRLREAGWPDGTPVDARSVRAGLQRQINALEGTSLGRDLAAIDELRAMTDRVIEIRLSQPMPWLLQLLSQPELGLQREGQGLGPMRATDDAGGVLLVPIAPELRSLPQEADFAERSRALRMAAMDVPAAIEAFDDGRVDIVTGGTLASLPLAETGPLSRGNLRLDGAVGLLGLRAVGTGGAIGDAGVREAVAMAIDRATLLQPFNLSGWLATTRIVPPGLDPAVDPGEARQERWAELTLETRRSRAARMVAAWEASAGADAQLALHLPAGPGSDRLFERLAADLATVGIELERARTRGEADLVLVDRLARYAGPRWFLNQFACGVVRGPCDPEADALLGPPTGAEGEPQGADRLVAAEAILLDSNRYIPLGAPIRWSLVRGGVEGFTENRWASHPLFPLAVDPIS